MDLWNLPGGGVERGELPTEAAIRETKEETGLDVVVERLAGVYGKAYKDEFVFSFLCRVIGGQLAVTDEADDNRYFDIEGIPANISPRELVVIHDAIDISVQPIFRRMTLS
jgi:8-oxo-dGTP diphosphatase